MDNNNPSKENDIERKLSFLESMFDKYGAVATELGGGDEENSRTVYAKGERFYRAGTLKFPESEELYLVISCTDEEKFARLGIMDDVDAFAPNLTDYELEEKVRFALGLD